MSDTFFNTLPLIFMLLYDSAEAVCSSNSDCVSFSSVSSDRRYCCGGTFCCTFEQFQMGVTSDPYLSMSIAAIIGILVGILVFLIMVALLVYYLMKGAPKGSLKRNSRKSDLDQDFAEQVPRPGHVIPKKKRSPHYDDHPKDLEAARSLKYPGEVQTLSKVGDNMIPDDHRSSDNKRHRKSRHKHNGTKEYDSHHQELRKNSRKRNYSPDTQRPNRDRHRRERYSDHGRDLREQ